MKTFGWAAKGSLRAASSLSDANQSLKVLPAADSALYGINVRLAGIDVLLYDGPACEAGTHKAMNDCLEIDCALAQFAKDATTDGVEIVDSLAADRFQDGGIHVLEMQMAYALPVGLDCIYRIAAAIDIVSCVEAQSEEFWIDQVAQPSDFSRGFDKGSRVMVKYCCHS